MTIAEMIEEARVIRDSTGARHGYREHPNVDRFRRLHAESGSAISWREALYGKAEV
jgi:hypothetical protein